MGKINFKGLYFMGNKVGAGIGIGVGIGVGVGVEEDYLENLGVIVNFAGGESVFGGISEVQGCIFD